MNTNIKACRASGIYLLGNEYQSIAINYTQKKHLADVTEIFNTLPWEKKQRLFKLGYLVLVLFFSIFCCNRNHRNTVILEGRVLGFKDLSSRFFVIE
ncbi:hypothetical protein V6N13_036373 [Hibiscus sabdariffa]